MAYQPFLSQIGTTLGQGLQQKGQNELIQAAYAGQPGAMEQLMNVNPQAAQQIQKKQVSEEQRQVQESRYQEEKTRTKKLDKLAALKQLRDMKDGVLEQVARMSTYEKAQSYMDQQIEMNKDLIAAAEVDPETINLTPETFEQVKESQDVQLSEVQSSKILPGGVVVSVLKNNDVEVYNPDTKTRDIIEAAELRGAKLQGLRSGEREVAKDAANVAAESFKSLAAVRKNISNMNEGIKLLEEGAATGAIESRFPSIKAASVKLENLKNRLGLDVIGSVTFGALSEGELKMALDTALPTRLDEKELSKWMTEKRDAQQKLAANLEEAALFLGEPGNNISDFIKLKKKEREDKKEVKTTPSESLSIMYNGKSYTFPDKESLDKYKKAAGL